MEVACYLERGPHSSAFAGIIQKQPYKTSSANTNAVANYLRCSNGYSSLFSSSKSAQLPPAALPERGASLGAKHFASSPPNLGSASSSSSPCCLDLAAPCVSDCQATLERRSVSSIHTRVGCECVPGARAHPHSRNGNVTGLSPIDSECRKNRNFGRRSDSPRAVAASDTRRVPGLAGWRNKNGSFQLLSRGFGGIGIGVEACPRFFVSALRGARRRRSSHGHLRHLCAGAGKSGAGQPVPEEENSEPASPEQAPPSVPGKSADLPVAAPLEHEASVDWRAFRARLVVTEHTRISNETGALSGESNTGGVAVGSLGRRWAHPILAPEAGCVLIATDKIDGQQSFERSVILLLSPGSSNPREGPYGLILNRPLSCRIKDIKPKDRTLVKFFGNCQVHHGGPLDEDMFLLLHGTEGVKGYREVIPGVYYGAASGLEEIMKGKRPLDYRFFFGYSGWGVEQLKKEIDAGLWCVAACSTDLITGHSAAGLWEEILLLMGGKYVELSKRPRRRHF